MLEQTFILSNPLYKKYYRAFSQHFVGLVAASLVISSDYLDINRGLIASKFKLGEDIIGGLLPRTAKPTLVALTKIVTYLENNGRKAELSALNLGVRGIKVASESGEEIARLLIRAYHHTNMLPPFEPYTLVKTQCQKMLTYFVNTPDFSCDNIAHELAKDIWGNDTTLPDIREPVSSSGLQEIVAPDIQALQKRRQQLENKIGLIEATVSSIKSMGLIEQTAPENTICPLQPKSKISFLFQSQLFAPGELEEQRGTARVLHNEIIIEEAVAVLTENEAACAKRDMPIHCTRDEIQTIDAILRASIKKAVQRGTETYLTHCKQQQGWRHSSQSLCSHLLKQMNGSLEQQLLALHEHFNPKRTHSAMGEFSFDTCIIDSLKQETEKSEFMHWLKESLKHIEDIWEHEPEKEQTIAFSLEARLLDVTRKRYIVREQFRLALTDAIEKRSSLLKEEISKSSNIHLT